MVSYLAYMMCFDLGGNLFLQCYAITKLDSHAVFFRLVIIALEQSRNNGPGLNLRDSIHSLKIRFWRCAELAISYICGGFQRRCCGSSCRIFITL